VTRPEAEERAARLQAEHPDRHTHRFFAREARGGAWEVARVSMPQQLRRPPLTPTIDAHPQPSPADDPRTGHERRAPGIAGGL